MAWQKDGEDGALKRVFLKSEGGDMSHINTTMSIHGGSRSQSRLHNDHESFPVRCVLIWRGASAFIASKFQTFLSGLNDSHMKVTFAYLS
jgi:hypothetical protein